MLSLLPLKRFYLIWEQGAPAGYTSGDGGTQPPDPFVLVAGLQRPAASPLGLSPCSQRGTDLPATASFIWWQRSTHTQSLRATGGPAARERPWLSPWTKQRVQNCRLHGRHDVAWNDMGSTSVNPPLCRCQAFHHGELRIHKPAPTCGCHNQVVPTVFSTRWGLPTRGARALSVWGAHGNEGAFRGRAYCSASGEILRPLQDEPQQRRLACARPSVKNESVGIEDDQIPL